MTELKEPQTLSLRDSTQSAWHEILAILTHAITHCNVHEDIIAICKPVLEDADFCRWPGSAKQHHCRYGGLLEHTHEVLHLAYAQCRALRKIGIMVDVSVVCTACIWHDLMKIRDYKTTFEDAAISVMHHPYHKLIHHIAGSYAAFKAHVDALIDGRDKLLTFNHPKPMNKWADQVGHAMLAHHGRLEWHSPVLPSTLEAQVVHQADNLSAKLDHATRGHENRALIDKQ